MISNPMGIGVGLIYCLTSSVAQEGWLRIGGYLIILISYFIFMTNKDLTVLKVKNTVTIEDVKANMQDIYCVTLKPFDKPVTFVEVRMKNGFTVRETTTCVDPANYSEEIGKEICLKRIEDKIWLLLGYALQDKLAQ